MEMGIGVFLNGQKLVVPCDSPKAEMLSQPLSHCLSSLWMSKHGVGGWVGKYFSGLNRLDVNTSNAGQPEQAS